MNNTSPAVNRDKHSTYYFQYLTMLLLVFLGFCPFYVVDHVAVRDIGGRSGGNSVVVDKDCASEDGDLLLAEGLSQLQFVEVNIEGL